jgi:hypothetical protein
MREKKEKKITIKGVRRKMEDSEKKLRKRGKCECGA